MMLPITLAIGFFTSIILQESLVNSFSFPLSLFPLHFLIGVLVFHRSGPLYGVLWFMTSWILFIFFHAPFLTPWGFLTVGFAGILFTKRIFTTRSVYALEGLGISLFLIFAITNTFFKHIPFKQHLTESLYGLLFVILGLYIGFILSKTLERVSTNILFIKKPTS